jgi:hypothetical protein
MINQQVLSVMKPRIPSGKILGRAYDNQGRLIMVRLNSAGFKGWHFL